MASPNYDTLSVAVSKMLGDPVAAATTDGKVWTSALRDVLLNTAHRRWMKKQILVGNYNALKGYKNREGKALSNNSLALSSWTGGVAYILSARNSTDGLVVRKLPDGLSAIARSGENTYLTPSTTNQFWVRESANFVLLDGGTTTGDTIELEYIKPHTSLSANGASDTSVPAEYYDEIVDLAFKVGTEERRSDKDMQAAQMKEQVVTQEIVAESALGDK